MAKKYPTDLYVAWEESESDETFLLAQATPDGLEEAGSSRSIGIYKLVRVAKLVNKVELK